ncbi:MAG: enoyl-CoA hydratase-related protein [Vulcanimicrobiaceae bacterium]
MNQQSPILYDVRDRIAYITLNRPEKRNAMSAQLLQELDEALAKAESDTGVRVIVIQGAGPSFCAGYDLTPTQSNGASNLMNERNGELRNVRRWLRMLDMAKPTIAKVHGYAVAGGVELAMMCDLVVATDDSKFGYPIVRGTGTPPMFVFPWLVGLRMTNELLFTGRLVSGPEAVEMRLINRAVPADKLDEELKSITDAILAAPADLIELIKFGIQQQYEVQGMRAGLRAGFEVHMVGHRTQSVLDFHKIRQEEGLRAALSWRDDR